MPSTPYPSTVALLTRLEGSRLDVYLDSAGNQTAGVGHKITPKDGVFNVGDIIPFEKAHKWLVQDIVKAERVVTRARFRAKTGMIPSMNPNEMDAMISLAFNIPSAFAAKTGLSQALAAGRLSDVPAEIRRWDKAKDPKTGKLVTVPGLVNRREIEARIFAGEPEPDEPAAPPAPRPTLRRGDTGPEVNTLLKMFLRLHGMDTSNCLGRHFGPRTEATVRSFQEAQGLKVDGICGQATWKALDDPSNWKGVRHVY